MKKVLCIVASLLLFTVAATAFAEEIVIKQWYHQYGEKGVQEAVMRYAEEYNALMKSEGKDVRVEVSWIAGDYAAKLSAALLTDEAPDVFESQLTLDLVGSGQITTLDDLFTPELKADFNEATMKGMMVDGKIYGIKKLNDSSAIYYRKSVLEAAGLSVPTTLDELVTVTKALDTGRVKGLYLGNDGGLGAMIARFVINTTGAPDVVDGKINFDNERTDAAIVKFGELYTSDALLIGAPTHWWDPSSFIDGLAAMQFCGLWAAPAIAEAFGDDAGVFAMPKLDDEGTPSYSLGGWIEMVNAKGAHIDEAKAFVKWLWLDNVALQEDFNVSYGFHVPPRTSVAAKAEKLKAEVPSVFIDGLSQNAWPEGPYWTKGIDTILVQAFVNIIKEGKDPRAEVSAAAQKAQAELDAATPK